jgi:hypothetical protein
MNREDFEPFMIDKSFDKFIHILSKDGTFSGNECLVAFSRHFYAKIGIHQVSNFIRKKLKKNEQWTNIVREF